MLTGDARCHELTMASLSASFATRTRAREVAKELVALKPPVRINWTGVRAVSPSFVDEFMRQIRALFSRSVDLTFISPDTEVASLLRQIAQRHDFDVTIVDR